MDIDIDRQELGSSIINALIDTALTAECNSVEMVLK